MGNHHGNKSEWNIQKVQYEEEKSIEKCTERKAETPSQCSLPLLFGNQAGKQSSLEGKNKCRADEEDKG